MKPIKSKIHCGGMLAAVLVLVLSLVAPCVIYTASASSDLSLPYDGTIDTSDELRLAEAAAPGRLVRAINGGGDAVGHFEADNSFVGGSTWATNETIDTTSMTNPAPQAVYQTERYGNFTYDFGGLQEGQVYTVRLHFAEIFLYGANQRVFDVIINGLPVLIGYDIFQQASGRNKAVVEEFNMPAGPDGISVQFVSIVQNAKCSGIEIFEFSEELVVSPEPIAWWGFDEASGTIAHDYRGIHHATVEGATWTAGRTGGALHFDGVDDMVTTLVAIDQTSHSAGVTLSAWVYPETPPWARHQVISSDDGGHDWSILCEGDGNWHVFTGGSSANTGLPVDLGQWQFVAAVFQPNSGIWFYKNDEEVFIPSIDYDTSNNNIAIGNNPGPWDEFFAGKIDEVRIYDRALSEAAIDNLFGRSEGNVDLDVDSDNNNMFNPPNRSLNEDAMENDPYQPGRIIVNNNDDNDGDQIPDFADGFNLDGIAGNNDDLNLPQQFVPLSVEIPTYIDLEQARIRIIYNESIPADTAIYQEEPTVYEPSPGNLRIWAQPGNVQRNAEHIARGGDFVIPTEYSPAHLGLTNRNRTVTWYVEGIQTSRTLADQEIIIEVDPDGPGPAPYAGDVVRLTVVDMQFMTQGPNGELVEQEFTYNSVPAPQIEATVEDCHIDGSGLVTMTINGTVTDQTSGIVSDPFLQLQNIIISPENQYSDTYDLVNTAEPEYPWQPYKFKAGFSAVVQLQTYGSGDYRVSLKTSENLAGIAAELGLFFVVDGLEVDCVREPVQTDPGTYLPTILRVDAPEGTFAEGEDTIHCFDTEWPLKYTDIGDGQYWYAMDSQDKVQVFLPALYASVIDATVAIKPIDDNILWWLKKADWSVGLKPVWELPGLIVHNNDVNANLSKITNYSKIVYKVGSVTKYIYTAKPGGAVHSDNTLDTEIKWRYINRADTVVEFKSAAEFVDDINHRITVVNTAKSVIFPFGTPSQFNPDFWYNAVTVKASKKASDAIADIFANQNKYKMACLLAALYVCENGAAQALGASTFDARIATKPGPWPSGNCWKVLKRIHLPNYGNNNHENNARWIPGDWGYIDNTLPNVNGLITGENVIYVGGCFDLAFANFKNNADFWGHIGGKKVKKLKDWMAAVEGWSPGTNMKILDHRDRLKP